MRCGRRRRARVASRLVSSMSTSLRAPESASQSEYSILNIQYSVFGIRYSVSRVACGISRVASRVWYFASCVSWPVTSYSPPTSASGLAWHARNRTTPRRRRGKYTILTTSAGHYPETGRSGPGATMGSPPPTPSTQIPITHGRPPSPKSPVGDADATLGPRTTARRRSGGESAREGRNEEREGRGAGRARELV